MTDIKTDSNGKKYVTVTAGDTLWAIAEKHLGAGNKYTQLATWNKLSNPDLIHIGQTIYIEDPKLSDDTSTTKASIKQFGLLSSEENKLVATWSFGLHSKTEHYQIAWKYKNKGFISIEQYAVDGTTTYTYSTCDIPDNAKYVKFRVRPISKKDSKENAIFQSTWTDWKQYNVVGTPATPATPTVEINELTLTARLDNLTYEDDTIICYEVVKDDSTVVKTMNKAITTSTSTAETQVTAGGKYKVRCRAKSSEGIYSDWSQYSANVDTIPANVTNITKCEARSDSSIYLEWAKANGAESYIIEHTQDKKNFDTNDQVSSISGITETLREVTGLTSGNEYFFRVKGVKGDKQSAKWSEISSAIIGTGPAAPTTWSSSTTAIIGEDQTVTLYWVHNSEDESSQKFAELELYIEGLSESVIETVKNDVSVEIGTINSEKTTVTAITDDTGEVTAYKILYHIDNTTDEKDKDRTHAFIISTANYLEGAKIRWRIRTAGITGVQGEEWSVEREIDIYSKPELSLSLLDIKGNMVSTLTNYPLNIKAEVVGYNTNLQYPIGYHISICVGDEGYETLDSIGNDVVVTPGQTLYAKYFDEPNQNGSFEYKLTPGDVSLENGYSYTIKCTVSMSSGTTVDMSSSFTTSWTDITYQPNAEIIINTDTYTATIRPYCSDYAQSYREVLYNLSTGSYYVSTNSLGYVYGQPVSPAKYTDTGERIYSGTSSDGVEVLFCEVLTETTIEAVTMAVYRREFDGSFTELSTGMNGENYSFITDPHPQLDYARYRIVATDNTTGTISYYDTPSIPVGVKSIIIQWDEDWVNFDASGNDDAEKPAWSGSLLVLPYNIDVSDKTDGEVSFVKYIGRPHPVSYYGTQVGSTSSWSVAIEKADKDTIYALRRLQAWMGNVYVREPSGTGYWANIKVSFNLKHKEVTVPVTFDVTRVEGD